MKLQGIICLMLPVLLIFFSCSRKTQPIMEKDITDQEVRNILQAPLPERNLHFAFQLMKALPTEQENFLISPFSISTALAMTYAGAREETQRQMIETLYFHPDQQQFHDQYAEYLQGLNELAGDSIQLNIANSLWAQQDYRFREEFFNLIENKYHSMLKKVDYKTNREAIRKDINQWVEDETRDKIKDLISPGVFTDDTRLVLVNAIYFYGPWLTAFDKQLTRTDRFTTAEGQQVMLDFMYRGEKLPYYEDADMQALEIPYAGESFSMVIMLPRRELSLTRLEERLDATRFLNIVEKMEKPSPEMDILIPRFEAEVKTDLGKVLASMGMPLAFTNKANFSGMTHDNDLKIDKVIHQAMIEVAEEGTEAAAATAVVVIQKTSVDEEKRILFKADRPFLFFIKDNRYNSLLFMGRMNNPAK